ncbi:MAG: sigma-70 family RNA polymerase sigma factor [Cypionkella sp.]|nr:sigma-70 family RNA polymerase sigma factor [Cypionkella sp.]
MMAVRDGGDRAAFAQLFHHFAPRVKGFLMKSGSDGALAEELAQDVMTTVWHKSAQFDPARASVATWIFTIARNRRIDHFRRTRRPEPEALDWGEDSEPDQADIYEAAQEARLLAAALETLPEAQRALIQSAFFGDLSHGEIAAQTGLPLGTIKSRIRLALERLRQTLK